MRVITYHITLEEAVLAPGLEGDPNNAVSYDFLPGSVLKGALIGRYGAFDAGDSVARRLFFDGQSTRYLNGYCLEVNQNGQLVRTLPTPRSWQQPKQPPLADAPDYFDAVFMSGPNRVTVGEPFWLPLGIVPHLVRPTKQVALHTARDREFGRARAAEGAVYQYEALASGQHFEAHIICQDGDANRLAGLVSGVACLGGARSAGYGRVTLEVVENNGQQHVELANWSEVGRRPPPLNDKTLITLLSDALIRDESGGWSADPRRLVAELTLELADGESVFAAFRPVGGFNRQWGVPLPQAIAFQMGSVLVCKPASAQQLTALMDRARDGVGERREDGFGRFAVNWRVSSSWRRPEAPAQSWTDVKLAGEPAGLAQEIARRVLRQKMEHQVTVLAGRLEAHFAAVKKSQLYRLRLAVQESLQRILANEHHDIKMERDALSKYLQSLDKRAGTRRQFERATVGGRSMLDWLAATIDTGNFQGGQVKAPAIGGQTATPDERLAFEFNLRLIDATLARMAKQKRVIEDNDNG